MKSRVKAVAQGCRVGRVGRVGRVDNITACVGWAGA